MRVSSICVCPICDSLPGYLTSVLVHNYVADAVPQISQSVSQSVHHFLCPTGGEFFPVCLPVGDRFLHCHHTPLDSHDLLDTGTGE